VIEIRHYVNRAGRDIYEEWLSNLGDKRTQAKITERINRMAGGNFGDCKPVGQGLWEFRIDWGPGYRVYYAIVGKELVLLVSGGDKKRQSADIELALECLRDYRERSQKR
jgi:putative addiction module killer protein